MTGPGRRRRGTRRAVRPERSRGVASVLSMMFLILFGSLAAAMAIASKGNLRTATAHLHVMRAMGAAETGLAVAQRRMGDAVSRFVVEKGEINADFGWKVWDGGYSAADGEVLVLPPPTGHAEFSLPTSVNQALANAHAADQNIVVIDGLAEPTIGPAPAGLDPGVYMADGWVATPAIALDATDGSPGVTPSAFQITYAPLAEAGGFVGVRAIVTGFDFDYSRNNTPLTRVVMQDFRLTKRVNQAVMSASRVMIGKNVMVHGDLGALYTGVEQVNGHPLVMKSDFEGIDGILDAKLADLYDGLLTNDVDGDKRLRVGHPIEGSGVPSGETDYNNDGEPDGAFADVTADGYVDEFDVFLKHFDASGDGKVALSAALTAGTPAQGQAPEFVGSGGGPADESLALLIDSSNPDRNRNRVHGFTDTNGNGRWDAGEPMLDIDASRTPPINRDQVLGYRDGFIDRKDLYAKVGGKLIFRVQESEWSAAQGDPMQFLEGPVRPPGGGAPVAFDASDAELPEVTAANFTNSQTALRDAADGASFEEQVAANLGVPVAQLATYVETSNNPQDPRYYRLDPDGDGDGLPDNNATAYFEKMPFSAPSYSDLYYRPVYENMIFKDVHVPGGNNGLFRGCTFVGVTYARTRTDNTHVNWTLYGKMRLDPSTRRPVPDPARTAYGDDPGETAYPPSLPPSALPPNQLVLLAASPLDKGDVTADQVPLIGNYADLPDPLLIDGLRVTDSKLFSNNLRFHDCLFVGSIISDTPGQYTNVRNKTQFTGSTRFVDRHPAPYGDDPDRNPDEGDRAEIAKSSMMLPNYSVDIGQFNSPMTQDVRLTGAIIAGILDVRGNASIDGALILTFAPIAGEGPLQDQFGNPVGNPADFNATLGYFGPDEGDAESLDPTTLPLGEGGGRIVGWDLDGDGLADLGPDEPPTPQQIADGATEVPFHGFGGIDLTFDPDMILPDGLMLPMQVDALTGTYREGRP